MVQFPPAGGNSVPQSSVAAKFVPASMLVMNKAALPALMSVIVWGLLVLLRV